jgi:hypothetical protein
VKQTELSNWHAHQKALCNVSQKLKPGDGNRPCERSNGILRQNENIPSLYPLVCGLSFGFTNERKFPSRDVLQQKWEHRNTIQLDITSKICRWMREQFAWVALPSPTKEWAFQLHGDLLMAVKSTYEPDLKLVCIPVRTGYTKFFYGYTRIHKIFFTDTQGYTKISEERQKN